MTIQVRHTAWWRSNKYAQLLLPQFELQNKHKCRNVEQDGKKQFTRNNNHISIYKIFKSISRLQLIHIIDFGTKYYIDMQ